MTRTKKTQAASAADTPTEQATVPAEASEQAPMVSETETGVSSVEEPTGSPSNVDTNTLSAPKQPEYPAFLTDYINHYPNNKTFHVTTDRMVFLAGDLGLAELHQQSLANGLKVKSYKIR